MTPERELRESIANVVCPNCGSSGKPRIKIRGYETVNGNWWVSIAEGVCVHSWHAAPAPTPASFTEETIEDGFGSVWAKYCYCGGINQIMRPGKIQCSEEGTPRHDELPRPAEPVVPEREPHGAICEGCGRPKPIILNTYVPICAACHQPYSVAAAPRAAGGQRITARQVYDALKAELDHPQGYISKDPLSLDSVTVDGVISCEEIAQGLAAAEPQVEKGEKT